MLSKFCKLFVASTCLLVLSSNTFAVNQLSSKEVQHFQGNFSQGTVQITLTGLRVTQFEVHTPQCSYVTHPNAKLNTGISVKFTTFGWQDSHNEQVSGVIAIPSTYLDSSITWKSSNVEGCQLPAVHLIKLQD